MYFRLFIILLRIIVISNYSYDSISNVLRFCRIIENEVFFKYEYECFICKNIFFNGNYKCFY